MPVCFEEELEIESVSPFGKSSATSAGRLVQAPFHPAAFNEVHKSCRRAGGETHGFELARSRARFGDKPFAKWAIGATFLSMLDSSEAELVSGGVLPTIGDRLPLQDKQSEPDHRELRIDKVGVRGLRMPIQVRDKAHSLQNTVATIGLYVDLPKEFKGTHMSRFIEVLHAHGSVVHVANIPDILYAMQETELGDGPFGDGVSRSSW
jgi:hypothetical protein